MKFRTKSKKCFLNSRQRKRIKKLWKNNWGFQQIANEKHDEALFRGYVVKQALMAKRTLDSDKATKADLHDELSMLISVCMAAPGVTIEYYTPKQEG